MKTKNILAVVVATLVISTALFAGNGQTPAADKNAPTMDGAVWGGNAAVAAPPSNPPQVKENNASDQGAAHQSLIDYLKALAQGLGIIAEGAVWG